MRFGITFLKKNEKTRKSHNFSKTGTIFAKEDAQIFSKTVSRKGKVFVNISVIKKMMMIWRNERN